MRGMRGMRKGKLLGRSFPLTLSRTFNRRICAQSLSLDINKLQVVRIYPPSSVAVATASPRGEAFRKAFSVFYIKARGQKFDSCLSVFNCSLQPRLLSDFLFSFSMFAQCKTGFPLGGSCRVQRLMRGDKSAQQNVTSPHKVSAKPPLKDSLRQTKKLPHRTPPQTKSESKIRSRHGGVLWGSSRGKREAWRERGDSFKSPLSPSKVFLSPKIRSAL